MAKWRFIYRPSFTLYVNIQNKNTPLRFAFISKENIHAKYCDRKIYSTICNEKPTIILQHKIQIQSKISQFHKIECKKYLNARLTSRSGTFSTCCCLALAVSKRWDDWDGNCQLPLVPLYTSRIVNTHRVTARTIDSIVSNSEKYR